MTRRPREYRGVGEPVRADVSDAPSLRAALQHCAAAYYLVHSLASADFEAKDAAAAGAFGEAAAEEGVERIIYLGGLGADDDDLSAHLRSRRQVEVLLARAGVPVTTLRAGIIVGHGGISWEMTRQLVEHLPAMITPRWVRTRTQPIAVADVIRYLVGVLQVPETAGRVFDIGGPDVLAYVDMLRRVAAVEGRRTLIVPVPLLSPSLSSLWLSLVTDVDVQTGRSLVDSMTNEVVVRDDSIRQVVPFEPMDFDSAVLAALGERAQDSSQVTRSPTGGAPRWGPRRGVPPSAGGDGSPPQCAKATSRSAHRRRVVAGVAVGGAGLLGLSLSSEPGSRRFYVLTLGVASTWLVGGVCSGPLHLGWVRTGERRVPAAGDRAGRSGGRGVRGLLRCRADRPPAPGAQRGPHVRAALRLPGL